MESKYCVRSAVFIGIVLVLTFVPSFATEVIYGLGAPGNFQTFIVDPNTGALSPFNCVCLSTFGASDSPFGGSIFVSTPINLWLADLQTGTKMFLGSLYSGGLDLAFDPSSSVLFGVGSHGSIFGVDYSCPGYDCVETLIGSFPGEVEAIDFVPGVGLYGAALDGRLWLFVPRINEFFYIGDTGIPNISDMAFDPASGRLIASAAGPKCFSFNCGPASGTIWSIDPYNGHSTLLNDNAPPIWGMAEVTPEPASLGLMLSGLAAVVTLVRLKRH